MIAGDVGALNIGIAMGAASMVSVGPNNLMLLKSGLSGRSPVVVRATVLASYIILIALGAGMARSSVEVHPAIESLLKWGGLFALTHFSVQSFRSALVVKTPDGGNVCGHVDLGVQTVLRTIWLNPLTYLELLLIPMTIARTMSGDADRFEFAIALLSMSALCCLAYASGGKAVSKLLKTRRMRNCFDLVSGTILAAMSAGLATELFGTIA